jgi:hypothetical protein
MIIDVESTDKYNVFKGNIPPKKTHTERQLELLKKAKKDFCDEPDEIIIDKTYFKLEGEGNEGDGSGDGSGKGQSDSSDSTLKNQKGTSKDIPDSFFHPTIPTHHWNPHPKDEDEEDFFNVPSIEELKEDDNLLIKVKKKFRW